MNIFENQRVFKNEKDGKVWYSTSLCKKLENGSYDHYTMLVNFPKNNIPAIGEKGLNINITKGFLSFTNGERRSIVVVVQDYNVILNNPVTYAENDLPF